ncbi:MAG: hypothetical protein D6758_11085, partial [Gammaproteobacteria bacterium]
MSLRYGFERLVLLGSAGYLRAELPLDGAVSLVAPNNTGKTSLINALQFMLIIDRRTMNFGAHDFDKTRRFYFPDNSAFILLEAMLPETGSVVLGCVGKGVSHDYEYFAYRGALRLEDYRKADGTRVAQPELIAHLARLGYQASRYEPREFADLLYGGRNRKTLPDGTDIRVFRLDNTADAQVYQRILTRTLRLDKLRSEDVKRYLLDIFRRDLPDAAIDFRHEWEKAFAEVNADRAQYLAARANLDAISKLEKQQEERLALRGELAARRPEIIRQLDAWEQYYRQKKAEREEEAREVKARRDNLFKELQEVLSEKERLGKQIEEAEGEEREQAELERRFALSTGRNELETQVNTIRQSLDRQIAALQAAPAEKLPALTRRLEKCRREQAEIRNQLDTLEDHLMLHLMRELGERQSEQLARVLSADVLMLPPGRFRLSAGPLGRLLAESEPNCFQMPGLCLLLDGLPSQYTRRTRAELETELADLEQEQRALEEHIQVAREREAALQERRRLEAELTDAQAALAAYDRMIALRESAPGRRERLEALYEARRQAAERIEGFGHLQSELDNQRDALAGQLKQLETSHQEVDRLRRERIDHGEPFTCLADLPHLPWVGDAGFGIADLATQLQHYHTSCRRLLELNAQLAQGVEHTRAKGLTKYQYSGSDEDELNRIIQFSHHLDQEAEAIERRARRAVVNVTSSLRDLRDGLWSFKARMREFNKQIGQRRLSDLAVFRIEAEDESRLVDAMELLIGKASELESGET